MSKYRILVVDDERDIRTVLRITLSREYEVVEAYDGLDALEKLDWVEPDLVILDVSMPVMDGIEACRAIRNRPGFRDIPILFLSVYGQRETMKDAYQSGANLYITKPFDTEQVMNAVLRLFAKGDVQPRAKQYSLQDLSRFDPLAVLPPEEEIREAQETGTTESAGPSQETRPEPRGERGPPPMKPRVLAVDDERDVRDLIAATLKEDFDVVVARDGVEAIEKITVFQPDIILLDAMMPGRDGYELCEMIRRNRRFQDRPIVFVSARSSEKARKQCMDAGADDFIAKPFEPLQLKKRLHEIAQAPDFVVHPREAPEIRYPGGRDETEE